MADSPIAYDYPHYRLLDGEVIKIVDWSFGPHTVVFKRPAIISTEVADIDDLTRPTRLHLQFAGDDDSPGGLLDEGDIQEGDFVIWDNPVHEDRLGPQEVLFISDTGKTVVVCKKGRRSWAPISDYRLATPAELREAGVEPPESNGEQPEDDDVDVSDAANRYVATQLQIAALRRLREAVEATERTEYARASVRATTAVGLIDDIIDREPLTHDTRTCPRCPGKSFTIIETVSRQRFATLNTTGRMHCAPPEGEEVVDRRLRCDCCQYEWRREGWEVTDG